MDSRRWPRKWAMVRVSLVLGMNDQVTSPWVFREHLLQRELNIPPDRNGKVLLAVIRSCGGRGPKFRFRAVSARGNRSFLASPFANPFSMSHIYAIGTERKLYSPK
jgi:hypothetical protein